MKNGTLKTRILSLFCAGVMALSPAAAWAEENEKGHSAVYGVLLTHAQTEKEETAGVRLDVELDFSAFDPEAADEDFLRYDQENGRVLVDFQRVLSGDVTGGVRAQIEEEEETGLTASDIRVENLTAEDNGGAVGFAAGYLALKGDGETELTDGENTVRVAVTGFEALLAREVTAEGAAIQVLAGFVPAGAAAVYAPMGEDEARALAERYLTEQKEDASEEKETAVLPMGLKKTKVQMLSAAPTAMETERTGSAVGYAAFSLSLLTEDGQPAGDGAYRAQVPLTADPEALVPEGAGMTGVTYALYHIHEDEAREIADFQVEAGTLTFTTDNFSDFILRYTVDFTYDDPATGESYTYNLAGGGEMLLSALLGALGADADLTGSAAFFSEDLPEGLLSLTPVYGEDGETAVDWIIQSLAPFSTAHTLTVALADGREIAIQVTDEQKSGAWSNGAGNSGTWVLSDDGTLTISGTGKLPQNGPWKTNASIKNSVKKLVLNDGITSTGYAGFEKFGNLTSVDFSNCSTLKEIEYRAFFESGLSEEIDLTNLKHLTSIGAEAFRNTKITRLDMTGCEGLSAGQTADGSIAIGNHICAGCSKLTEIVLSDAVSSIGNYAFENCKALVSANLPAKLKNIPEGLLNGDSALQTLSVPENYWKTVESIGNYAFYDCSKLALTLDFSGSDRLASIGLGAFARCANLTGILDLSGVTTPGGFVIKSQGLTSKTNGAFSGCGLSGVTFKGSTALQSIGDYAFENNKAPGSSSYTLSSIDFSGCTGLEHLGGGVFKNSVAKNVSFSDCASLREYSVGVSEGIFSNNSVLETVDLSGCSALEEIGQSAFTSGRLTRIDLTGCDGLKKINHKAFDGRQNCEILLPEMHHVEFIGDNAFYNDQKVYSVNLANSPITSIGEKAFYQCYHLNEVKLDGCDELTKIGPSAFEKCAALESIVIPRNVSDIAGSAFVGCNGLQSITWDAANYTKAIPDALISAKGYDLKIGGNVASLPTNFFSAFKDAEDIYFEGVPEGHVIDIPAAATAGARTPLNAIQHPCYVDEYGVVYELMDGYAQVAYCPPGISEYTVPAQITADGKSYPVTAVAPSAFTLARNLQIIEFENPGQVTVGENAFQGVRTLVEVKSGSTRKHTIAGAKSLFLDAKDSSFQNTGLADDLEHFWSKGTESNSLTVAGIGTQSLNVSIDGENQLLTNQPLTLRVSISSGGHNGLYRIYMAFSDDQHSELKGTIDLNGVQGTYRDMGENVICLEFDMSSGANIPDNTFSILYPNGTAGGNVHIWGEILEKDQKDAPIYSLQGPTENYLLGEWTTQKAQPALRKEVKSGTVNIQGSGDITRQSTIYPIDGQVWTVQIDLEEQNEINSVGQEYVRQILYRDTMTLPQGVAWAPELVSAIRSGSFNLTSSKAAKDYTEYKLSVGGREYLDLRLPPNTSIIKESISLTADENDLLTLEWLLKNPNYKNQEFTELPVELVTLNGALIMDLSDVWLDSDGQIVAQDAPEAERKATDEDFPLRFPILNSAEAQLTYAFGEIVEVPSSKAQTVAVAGEAKLSLEKERSELESNRTSFGTDVTFTLTASNSGAAGSEKVYTLQDTLDARNRLLYIKPAAMERMFQQDIYGQRLKIVIQNADEYNWASPSGDVTDTQGHQMTLDEYSGGNMTSTRHGTLTLSWNGTNYTAQWSDGTSKTAAALEEALGNYHVDGDDEYTVAWTFTKEEDSFFFAGGLTARLPVYATHKTAFQLLIGNNKRTVASANLNNEATLTYKDGETEKRLEDFCVPWQVSGDLGLNKTKGETETIQDSTYQNYKLNSVVPYTVTLSNGSGAAHTKIPVTDEMTGNQLLLAKTGAGNNDANLSGLYTVTLDGNSIYYVLTEGEYKDIWIGGWVADRITVKKSGTGYETEVEWYVPSIAARSSIQNTYYSMAVSHDPENGSPYMSYTYDNTVKLNKPLAGDKAVSYSQSGGGASYDVDKHIVLERGETPGQDKLDADGYTWLTKSENQVLYRISLVFSPADPAWTTSVKWSELADLLPLTSAGEKWKKDGSAFQVEILGAEAAGTGTVTIKGDQDQPVDAETMKTAWQIEHDDTLNRDKIVWDGNNTIVMQGRCTLNLYVQLTYEAAANWDDYCKAADGDYIDNTFCAGTKQAAVYHDVKGDQNEALLQKGVNYVYSVSATDSRLDYSNVKGAVEYYALLYNGGHSRLYVDRLTDFLPDGFTFYHVSNDAQVYSETNHSNTANTKTDTSSIVRLDDPYRTGQVQFVSAQINASGGTQDGEPLVFTIQGWGTGNNRLGRIRYDEYLRRYYLNPGEAIAFSYVAKVSDQTALTRETAVNTLNMRSSDPAGLTIAKYDPAGFVHTGKERSGVEYNDGKQAVIGDGEGLSASVTLRRGSIIPGVGKTAVSYMRDTSSAIPINGQNNADLTEVKAITWEVETLNNGTSQLSPYSIIDTMQSPFYFSGGVWYTVYEGETPVIQAKNAQDVETALFELTYDNGTYQIKEKGETTYTLTPGTKETVTLPNIFVRGVKSAEPMTVYVTLTKEGDNWQLRLDFPEDVMPIPAGAHGKLKLTTATLTQKADTYANTAVLLPEDQRFTSRAKGTAVTVDGKNAVRSKAEVTVVSQGVTTSNISVTAHGETVSNQVLEPKVVLNQPGEEFTYTLTVKNSLTTQLDQLVLLANLPEPGDHYTFNSDSRDSQYKVSLAGNPFKVELVDVNGDKTPLDPSLYTIQYSTKTSTYENDDKWGTSTGDWRNNQADARAVRIILNSELQSNCSIEVSFDCVADVTSNVESPERALPGEEAYMNFGYAFKQGVAWHEASPRSVSVAMPKLPTLQKKIVNLKGVEKAADDNLTFYFLIYPVVAAPTSENIQSLSASVNPQELMNGSPYSSWLLASVTVSEGQDRSSGAMALDPLQLNKDGFWENGKVYAVTELQKDSRYQLQNWELYEDGSLRQGPDANLLTFTYKTDTAQHILAANEDQIWSVKLTKRDSVTNAPIPGAAFGLYQKDNNGKASVTAYGRTWYLKEEKTTDNSGVIIWEDLFDSEYLYREIRPAAGYYAASGDGWIVRRSDITSGTEAAVGAENAMAWLTVYKQVEGERASLEQDFTFTISVNGAAPGTAYRWEKGEDAGTVADRTGTFTLKSGENIRLYVPVGTAATVTEDTINYMVRAGAYEGVGTPAMDTPRTGESTSHYGYAQTFTIQEGTAAEPYITMLNDKPICKIVVKETVNGTETEVEHPFRTLQAAMKYIHEMQTSNPSYVGGYPVIEMLVDYTMPENDQLIILADDIVTLTTAATSGGVFNYEPDQPGNTVATITRGYDGDSMVTTSGDLTLASIILDGADEKEQERHTGLRSNEKGGIVKMQQGKLTVKPEATLQNAYAENGDGGGAIYMMEGELTMNGLIQNCSTGGNGGGIFAANGTVDIGGTISGCAAEGGMKPSGENKAAIGDGGAIKTSKDTKVKIQNSAVLSGNQAKGSGGAVYTSGDLTVSGGDILNNSAKDQGGGIYLDNSATINMTGGMIRKNKAVVNGGGIQDKSKNTNTISGGTITENTAKKGGGISIEKGTLTLSDNVQITENTATDCGGGLYVTDGSTAVNLQGGQISGNTANNGGGVYLNNGTFNQSGGSIEKNNASANGGGVYLNDGTFNQSGGSIEENSASVNGGGVYQNTQAVYNLSGGGVEKNEALSGSGGGVYAHISAAPTITGGQIRENTAQYGGGIYYKGGVYGDAYLTLNVRGGQINGNTAQYGGGVYGEANLTLNVTGGQINGNTANSDGGGAYLKGAGVKMIVSGGTIHQNTAVNQGGGVMVNPSAVLTLRDSASLRENTAGSLGGAVYLAAAGTMNMSGGVIVGNSASNAIGGAVNVAAATSRINLSGDPTIYGNLGSGGAQKNIVLSVDSNEVIRVVGELDRSSNLIGVYVPSGLYLYDKHGGGLDPFGTYTDTLSTDPFYRFHNDVNGLTGGGRTPDHRVVWIKMAALTVTKTISGDMADLNRTFTFTLSVDGDYSYGWTTNGTDRKTFTTGVQDPGTFALGNRQSRTFDNIPAGSGVTVTELDAGQYTVTAGSWTYLTQEPEVRGSVVSFEMSDEADRETHRSAVTVNNHLPAVTPTGVTLSATPFLAMLLGGAALLALALWRRKKE